MENQQTLPLRVKTRRHYSPHKALLSAAERYLRAAEQEEPFCHDGHFVSMILSALAIEALCNTTGELIVSEWNDFEKCPPMGKVRLLCENLCIEYAKEQEPFATLRRVIRFRNGIAHGKPEALEADKLMSPAEWGHYQAGNGPQSRLEQQVSFSRAHASLEAVEALQRLLCEKLSPEDRELVEDDFMEMTAERVAPGSGAGE